MKILLSGIDVHRLRKLDCLEFKGDFSEKTGEVGKTFTAKYHFCKITIKPKGTVLFSGSIHKLYNSLNGITAPNKYDVDEYKGFNGNQFNLKQIIEVRNHLQTLLNVKAEQMIIQNIEFGVNAQTKYNPQKLITGLLFQYSKPFSLQEHRHFAQVKHQQYYLKIYNKSNQYGLKDHTTRAEIKIIKSRLINPLGIYTFADINENTLEGAKKLLIDKINQIVYIDSTINKKRLTRRQKDDLLDFENWIYWKRLEPKFRYRPKKKLEQLNRNYSNQLLEQLKSEIIAKCRIINRSNIGLNVLQRRCPVTGKKITMQKGNSKLLSCGGLRYLEKQNPQEFEKLKLILLTGRENKFETNVYEKLAKQIRNKYYNNRAMYKQPRLFEF